MKLSIITINYNNAAGLAKTIESVGEQSWKDFEYIVIDGGSSDDSIEVIRKYSSHISYWVSEPDNGIYNAMNKGIRLSCGEYLLMLNSGDYLSDKNVLERVFSLNLFQEDILTGDIYRSSNGQITGESPCPDNITFNLFRKGSLHHQGTFIRKSLHDVIGYYDEGLKFSSDWKFFLLAICKYNISYKHLPFFISVCDCEGSTFNPANFSQIRSEFDQVLNQYFPAFLDDYENFEKRSKSFGHQVNNLSFLLKARLKKLRIKLSFN